MSYEQMEEMFVRSVQASLDIVKLCDEKNYHTIEYINGLGIALNRLMIDLEIPDEYIIEQMKSWHRVCKQMDKMLPKEKEGDHASA